MYSLILKISHNVRVKDAIATVRGIYRVVDGAYSKNSAYHVRKSDWINQEPINTNNLHSSAKSSLDINSLYTQNKSQTIIPQISKDLENNINKQRLNMQNSQKQINTNKLKIQQINKHQNILSKQESKFQSAKIQKTKRNIEQQWQKQKQAKMKKQQVKLQQPKSVQKQKKADSEQKQKIENKEYLRQFDMKNKKIEMQNKFKQPQVSGIPSSRIGRLFQFGKLGLSLASASIFSNSKDQKYLEGVAQKVTNQLCKMRGAPLKLAQMLSIQQQNLIPLPVRRAFQKARQSAHVIPQQQVELMLKKNLGDKWQSRLKQFNFTPVAAASIGQVHKAVLHNNSQVAIKVQYFQVRQSIQSDIQNLGLLLKLPGVFPKGMYVQKILTNTRAQLIQECDYMLEKFYQQKYDQYLKKCFAQQYKLYKVPQVIPEFTTTQILTSQFVTGIKMKDLEEGRYSQQLRDQIGRRIMKLTFKQLFEMGIMQSDPNPSNFTYNHINDQLNLYDFGATHIYKKQFLQNYYKIIQGSVLKDQKQVWQASVSTGFVTGQQNTVMKSNHIQSIMITGQPLRHVGKYDFGSQQITNRIYKTIPLMLKNRLRPPPEQVYSLHRKLSGSYLACIRLKSRVDCNKIWNQIQFKTLASHETYYPVKSDQVNIQQ